MRKRDLLDEACAGRLAGFVYIATNPAMPGYVKAGRTQGRPEDRMRGLYSTGVPERFSLESAKFFVDCYTAEEGLHALLAELGTPCHNREFFRVEKDAACRALLNLYRNQSSIGTASFGSVSQAVFERSMLNGPSGWPVRVVEAIMCLPSKTREKELLGLLAIALEHGAESWAIWLIRTRGVDPEIPLQVRVSDRYLDMYRLTAYENSIFLGQARLEAYLEGIGCSVFDSNALCWVIDNLINSNRPDAAKAKIVDFGLQLLKRGADVSKVLEVGLFIDSPRIGWSIHGNFRYDLFPRNSQKSCRELISLLSETDEYFAQLYAAMLSY